MPGEIADAMLEGLLCQGCGEYLGDGTDAWDLWGFPQFCAACNAIANPKPRRLTRAQVRRAVRSATEPMCCPYCSRRYRGELLREHLWDWHRATMALEQEPL
jgi:hypothetical protein